MRKFCPLRASLKSTILRKKLFLKSMILIVKFFLKSMILVVNFFLKSMILNEKVFVKGMILKYKFFVLSDFESIFFWFCRISNQPFYNATDFVEEQFT